MNTRNDEHLIALNKAGLAFAVLRYFLIERGMLKLGLHVKRDIGNVAKAIDVPTREVEQVLYPIFRNMLEEVFPSFDTDAEYVYGLSVETGETSRKILKYMLGKTNASLHPDGAREMSKMALEIGFPYEMVVELLRPIYEELLAEMFKTVSTSQGN